MLQHWLEATWQRPQVNQYQGYTPYTCNLDTDSEILQMSSQELKSHICRQNLLCISDSVISIIDGKRLISLSTSFINVIISTLSALSNTLNDYVMIKENINMRCKASNKFINLWSEMLEKHKAGIRITQKP